MNLDPKHMVESTIAFVKSSLSEAEGGHDWWHTYRVLKLSRAIANKEKANLLICELGALLHDIADPKFHKEDVTDAPAIAIDFLKRQELPEEKISSVVDIIRHISFQGGTDHPSYKSLELQVVQDADRLDAIGAIGIARTFHYGGFKNRKIYDPEIPPKTYSSPEEYRKSDAPTINHFYEKLLLLRDLMNTATGKKMANNRHRYLEKYLRQFFDEWEGRK